MSDEVILQAEADLQRAALYPGQYWRHYRGAVYQIVGWGLREEDCAPVVAYSHVGEMRVWYRPLANWLEMVEVDGRQIQRFSRVE